MAEVGRILIVGGGIGGLSAATALHAHGFAPEVVERSPSWPTEGAGITLHANGVRVLRSLRLGPAVDRATAVLPGWAFHDQHGELLCGTGLEALWGEVSPCLGITRARLQEVLLAGAAAVPHRLGVVPARPAGVTRLAMFMGNGNFFGLVPVGDGHTYGFAGLDAERFDDPRPGRLQRFRERFADFGGPPSVNAATSCSATATGR
jgi:hypothetical protein